MRSLLISEPASPGEVLIAERSDQIEYDGAMLTFYCGAFTRIGLPWKPRPCSVVSSVGILSAHV